MTERETARAQAEALKSAANDLPGWVPGRERVSKWLWERAAVLESGHD